VALRPGARVAVVGAGPGGLAAAKHAREAGFDVTVFEASDDLGGQWHTTAAHSGVWPGMRTNTSRAMTAFSDLPSPAALLHPPATEVHAYLRAYADRFGVTGRIRLGTPVRRVSRGWTVDGEPFDAVVLASGRFHRPQLPEGLAGFAGELLHAFDYPGAAPFAGRRVLVLGNGISGNEIASDLAQAEPVVAAFRKPRWVIRKVEDGVPSDWQWYTHVGALERRTLPRAELARLFRARLLRVAGDPAAFGAPAPDPDVFAAGLSLCQDWLAQVADGRIACRPAIASVRGRTVTFMDGSAEAVDVIVCATGYAPHLPYLDAELARALAGGLYECTLHPDLPELGVIGQFLAQGPFLPLLELQARWIVATWTGEVARPPAAAMRAAAARRRPSLEPHNALATTLAEALGVLPDPLDWPDLLEPLLFGPLLPPRHRLSGPGAQPEAAARFAHQLAASPRAPVDPDDVARLPALGLAAAAERLQVAA
jgi:cation diffusion facilitator CzcD-associated flavoprotein CzcO